MPSWWCVLVAAGGLGPPTKLDPASGGEVEVLIQMVKRWWWLRPGRTPAGASRVLAPPGSEGCAIRAQMEKIGYIIITNI